MISGLEITQNYDILKTSQAFPTEKVSIFTNYWSLPTNFPDADMIQPHSHNININNYCYYINEHDSFTNNI